LTALEFLKFEKFSSRSRKISIFATLVHIPNQFPAIVWLSWCSCCIVCRTRLACPSPSQEYKDTNSGWA